MRFRYADKHGLSVLALVAVVLLTLGGQRGAAASVFPSPTPGLSFAEGTAFAGVSPLQTVTQSSTPALSEPALSELEETREELRVLRAMVSSRGGRTPAPQAPSQSAPIAPANVSSKVGGTVIVPILMYHHIDVAGPKADAIRQDLSVTPANFAAQVSYLERNGYHTLSLADLVERMVSGTALPKNPVVLTFDDGYLDNYTNAYPVLKGAGLTGTFFIITDFAGQGEYMSWDQAAEMAAAGLDLESHTLDHPDLSLLPADRLARQLTESRAILEKKLGKPVRYLSYPAGRYNAAVVRATQQAGYLGAVTTVYGESHAVGGQFELTRVRVRGTDSLEVFAQKVHGPDPARPRDAGSARLTEAK